MANFFTKLFQTKNRERPKVEGPNNKRITVPPGRVSVANDDSTTIGVIKNLTNFVTPSFRTELIPLIRDLYKVNPDIGIAVRDMYKLANTPQQVNFPYNTPKEAREMRKHLKEVSKRWTNSTSGIHGLTTKMIIQCSISGAVSIEAVPKNDLSGVSNIVFINPDDIKFIREVNGIYHPYQKNRGIFRNRNKKDYIKLNLSTYKYVSMYNDTDEPYGVPPYMTALDSIKSQADMTANFKHIMEMMGMLGFLELKIEGSDPLAGESNCDYIQRIQEMMNTARKNTLKGMKDGIVVGIKDDYEYNFNSTSANLNNVDKLWSMNEQLVANGLGVNGNILGVSGIAGEGSAGVMLSKMISQLKDIHAIIAYVWEFIYTLELMLAGFNNKGLNIKYANSTVTDDIKYQQAQEYKARTFISLYNQGIISQDELAFQLGYDKPDQQEPRETQEGVGSIDDSAAKSKREADKDKSDRKTRDKNNPSPKRKDGDTKER